MTIKELYSIYKQYPVVCTDTRNIKEGSLFFALKGPNFNANEFAKEAITKGAKYSIIDEAKYQSENCILVEDVLTNLQQLANYHRKQQTIPFIGITGSNGKTTTKELIHAVLSTQYKVRATKGNLNNHIGVPLTLLSMPTDTEIAIVEMGANGLKEIEMLCKIAEPSCGMITNIGKAHLEGFGSIEGTIKTKGELYESVIHSNGVLFQNKDNEILTKITKGYPKIEYYSVSHKSNTQGVLLESNPYLNLECNNHIFHSNLIGEYNLENILAAICIGKHFNVSLENIAKAIENYAPDNNRSQLLKKDSNFFIMDAYNANPTSMTNAIESFAKQPYPNKILILGDMFELGVDSQKEHQEIVELCKKLELKTVYLLGLEFKKTSHPFSHFDSASLLKEKLDFSEIKNTHFLIKGSRGMKLEQILN